MNGFDALVQHVEIATANGTPAFVEFVEVAIETEQRAEHGGIEEVHQRVEFINAVLDGCAGEDEGVTAAQALHGLGSLSAPVLDALGFVEHNDVRREAGVHVERVGNYLLVVDNGEEGEIRNCLG